MKVFKYIAVLVALGMFLTISSYSYEDEIKEQHRYCKDVKEGLHPDYLNIFNKECK